MNVAVRRGVLRLNHSQREALSETVRELANVVAGVVVLGQFIGEQPVSFSMVIGGVAAWLVLVACGVLLAGGKSDESDG